MPFRAKIVCVNGVYLNFALVLTAVPARFKKRSWNCRYIHPCYNIDYLWQVGSIPNVDSSVLSLASKFGFKFSLWTVNKFTSSYSRVGSIPAQAVCCVLSLLCPLRDFPFLLQLALSNKAEKIINPQKVTVTFPLQIQIKAPDEPLPPFSPFHVYSRVTHWLCSIMHHWPVYLNHQTSWVWMDCRDFRCLSVLSPKAIQLCRGFHQL